jgi:hypothetical protein
VSGLVIYWVGWSDLLKTIPIVAVGLVWYAVTAVRQRHGWAEMRGGLWLLAHLVVLYSMSAIGSFDGLGVVPAPWDSALVAVVSLGIYFWGCASGTAFLRANPGVISRIDESSESTGVAT